MKQLRSYADTRAPKKPRGREERFADLKDETLRAFVRGLPCLLQQQQRGDFYQCSGLTECAHVKSKGAAGGDWDNLVPLCQFHHMDQHRVGVKSFEFHYDIRLKAAAKKVTALYIGKVKHG